MCIMVSRRSCNYLQSLQISLTRSAQLSSAQQSRRVASRRVELQQAKVSWYSKQQTNQQAHNKTPAKTQKPTTAKQHNNGKPTTATKTQKQTTNKQTQTTANNQTRTNNKQTTNTQCNKTMASNGMQAKKLIQNVPIRYVLDRQGAQLWSLATFHDLELEHLHPDSYSTLRIDSRKQNHVFSFETWFQTMSGKHTSHLAQPPEVIDEFPTVDLKWIIDSRGSTMRFTSHCSSGVHSGRQARWYISDPWDLDFHRTCRGPDKQRLWGFSPSLRNVVIRLYENWPHRPRRWCLWVQDGEKDPDSKASELSSRVCTGMLLLSLCGLSCVFVSCVL